MDSTASNEIRQLIDSFSAAGARLCEMQAAEGCGGNLSVCVDGLVDGGPDFDQSELIELPALVPELSGKTIVVTGSSTRMRDISKDPGGCLAVLRVQQGGSQAAMHFCRRRKFTRVTSELNSHLAVHCEALQKDNQRLHAVVHAQPRKLTYLSHLSEYQNEEYLNRRLLRWQPEAVLNFPEGIAVVPFAPPSTAHLMRVTRDSLRHKRALVWAKHGVVTHSSQSLDVAVDFVDYLEAAAAYECLDLVLGQRAQGLDEADLAAVCAAYGVHRLP